MRIFCIQKNRILYRFTGLAIIVLSCCQVFADTLTSDKAVNITLLEDKLKNSSLNDKPGIYNKLANEYLLVSAEKSLKYARNSINLSVISDNKIEEAYAYYILGMAYTNLNNFQKARMNFETALELQEQLSDRLRMSDIYLALGRVYESMNNFAKAKEYIGNSIAIETELGNGTRISQRNREMADICYQEGSLNIAIENYLRSLKYEQELDCTEHIANIYNNLGIVYFDLGNYEQALEYYLMALKLMESNQDIQGQAFILNNIGIVYYEWGNPEQALEYYQKSLIIEKEYGSEEGLSGSYNNIGIIYSDWGQNELAIDYYKKSLMISRLYNNKKGIAQTMNNMGESYFEMGQHEKSLEFLLESLEIEKDIGSLSGLAESYHTVGSIYYKLGDLQKGLRFIDSSSTIADTLDLLAVTLRNYSLYAKIYSDLNQYKNAYNYLNKSFSLKDTIYSRDFHEQLMKIQLKYEVDKMEEEKLSLEQKYSKQEDAYTKQRIYLVIVFVLLLAFIVYIIYDRRLSRKATKELIHKNKLIEQQKEVLSATLGQLQKSEEKYKKLVWNSPTGILYIDTEGKILEANSKLLEILGSPGEEETKKINLLNFPPLQKAGLVDDVLESIKTGNTHYNEASYKSKWGKDIEVRYYITPLKNELGEVTHILLNIKDITTEKVAKKALSRSEQNYKNLVENSLQGMFVLHEGKIVYANSRMKDLTQYSASELTTNHSLWDDKLLHPEDRYKVNNLGTEISGKDKIRTQVRFIRKDSTIRWIEILASPTEYQGKNSYLILAIDISGHKEAEAILKESEAKLREANATKDKFFSIIAHDLKNPFNAIIGFARLLLESYESIDVEQHKKIIGNICEASENAFKLLHNLLDWSLTQTGRIENNPVYIDLTLATNEVLSIFKSSSEDKKITMVANIPFNLKVYADAEMFKTILRNLVSNAIKFSSEKGTIELRAEESQKECIISVKDEGVGMDKAQKDRLFNLDYLPETKNGTANESGSGLGLILCKEFIEMNRGKIWVESKPGNGSVFYISLPMEI
ncbi:MAG: tetratricopeptide repeat protein [Bacteroidales bacterium]|nr:tetratricopeptide repeat protein [Bacteroidales bacterium]